MEHLLWLRLNIRKTSVVCIVLSVAQVHSVNISLDACSDLSNHYTCNAWKNLRWCVLSNVRYYCKKTCGVCGGVTQPPVTLPPRTFPPDTRPPITQPPGTQGPVGACGTSSVQQSRIVEGEDAQKGAWPWIASLQKNRGHFCGGTLLTPKWVSINTIMIVHWCKWLVLIWVIQTTT